MVAGESVSFNGEAGNLKLGTASGAVGIASCKCKGPTSELRMTNSQFHFKVSKQLNQMCGVDADGLLT